MGRKIGVIGCGAIVQQVHLPTLTALEGVEVSWLLDKNNARAEQLAKMSGIPSMPYIEDFSSLPDVDVVLLATPWGPRRQIYDRLALLGSSKPALYVEKPFAKSVEEHRSIQANYEPARLAIGFMRRSFGALQCVRRMAIDEVFGKLRGVDVRFGGAGRILTRGGYAADLEIAGGGSLFEMGIHYLDAALYCVRATEVSVGAKNVIYHEGFDVHVDAALAVTDELGGIFPARVRVSQLEHLPAAVELSFENAVVEFDIAGAGDVAITGVGVGARRAVMQTSPREGPIHALAMAARHWELFFAAIDTGSCNLSNACSSEVTTKALEGIYA